ncbi:hypothetical protein S245_058042, partial [Arachis hypogaea]
TQIKLGEETRTNLRERRGGDRRTTGQGQGERLPTTSRRWWKETCDWRYALLGFAPKRGKVIGALMYWLWFFNETTPSPTLLLDAVGTQRTTNQAIWSGWGERPAIWAGNKVIRCGWDIEGNHFGSIGGGPSKHMKNGNSSLEQQRSKRRTGVLSQ